MNVLLLCEECIVVVVVVKEASFRGKFWQFGIALQLRRLRHRSLRDASSQVSVTHQADCCELSWPGR